MLRVRRRWKDNSYKTIVAPLDEESLVAEVPLDGSGKGDGEHQHDKYAKRSASRQQGEHMS